MTGPIGDTPRTNLNLAGLTRVQPHLNTLQRIAIGGSSYNSNNVSNVRDFINNALDYCAFYGDSGHRPSSGAIFRGPPDLQQQLESLRDDRQAYNAGRAVVNLLSNGNRGTIGALQTRLQSMVGNINVSDSLRDRNIQ